MEVQIKKMIRQLNRKRYVWVFTFESEIGEMKIFDSKTIAEKYIKSIGLYWNKEDSCYYAVKNPKIDAIYWQLYKQQLLYDINDNKGKRNEK